CSCPPRPFAVLLACNCRYSRNGWFAVVQHRHALPRLPVGSEAGPHSSMGISRTEKSVAKGLPFAILPESPLGLVGSCHAFLGSAASLPTSSIPRSDDQSRLLAVLARLVQPPRRGSTPLRPWHDRLFHSHLHMGSHRWCIVHASVAPPPTTGAHVAPRQGVHHPQHG